MITQSELKDKFNYNKETGVFTYKQKTKRSQVGDVAGSNTNGYLCVSLKGKTYKLHRLAWLYVYGVFPDNIIDHINHDKTDNRISNLRDVTHQDNLRNKRLRKNSVHHGVTWNKLHDCWDVKINNEYVGSFEQYPDAVKRRKELEKENNYHKNHGKTKTYNHYNEVMKMYRERGMK